MREYKGNHRTIGENIMAAPTLDHSVVTETSLKAFAERAPVYDRENRFFSEDFEDLRKAGYLKIAIPKEFGGNESARIKEPF